MLRLGNHPVNLALRFMLEVAMMVALSFWGYEIVGGGHQLGWAILFPVLAMSLWVIFATRNDPSRSGKTVVQTPGVIRLALEWTLFSCAFWALLDLGRTNLAFALVAACAVHYLTSMDRIQWLLKQR